MEPNELHKRLAAAEKRLEELAGRLTRTHFDGLGRIQSLAEDALARASNAREVAEAAEARAVGAEGKGVDALARAANAEGVAEDALGRVVDVERQGVDACAAADNAREVADGALERIAAVEGTSADALARADNAREVAEAAEARAVGAEGKGVDALARSANAEGVAEDALGRVVDVERQGVDARTAADNAQRLADKALRRAALAQGQGEDAQAAAGLASSAAKDALLRAETAVAQAHDALAVAEHARELAHEARLPARMVAFEAWLELRPPDDGPLVSVILPTRDRPTLLPGAVGSMLEQRYERWELVVVDDGDTDAVATALADVDDDRVVVVQGPRSGLGAARNAGLDAATGEVVCYLDDDNAMHPSWLLAVAHVFTAREDVDVAYGVAVAEHRVPDRLDPGDWWPSLWQLPWSREKLLEENLTDAGALAHRRELPEARFDDVKSGEDWDLLIRLTADRPALAIPALSHAYAISGDGHMSRDPSHRDVLGDIRRRHADG
jgi:hypothetical protein